MQLAPRAAHSDPSARRLGRRAAVATLLVGAASAAGWRWYGPRTRQAADQSAFGADAMGDDVCVVAPATPYDANSGLPMAAAREVPADARCPVCGMFPARSRSWAAQVIFADGDAHFFDSALSLMMYLGNVAHYTRGRTAEAVVARYVTDTDTGAWVEAQHASYVAGSSMMGPMRSGNLPALADGAAALRFVQRHGGRVLAWSEIDTALLRTMAPNLRADHRQH